MSNDQIELLKENVGINYKPVGIKVNQNTGHIEQYSLSKYYYPTEELAELAILKILNKPDPCYSAFTIIKTYS